MLRKSLLDRFIWGLSISLVLSACGGGGSSTQPSTQNPVITPPDTGDAPPTNKLSVVLGGSEKIPVVFEEPFSSQLVNLDSINLPIERKLNSTQKALSTYYATYDIHGMWDYKDLLPHPNLFCDKPVSAAYEEIGISLGGFTKTSSIAIERDATAPFLFDGIPSSNWLLETGTDSGMGGAVSIERPDLIGQVQNRSIYLSDIYGLIYVDQTPMPVESAVTSCALPLPGNAKNFVMTDEHIIVIVHSTDRRHSGLLQFSIESDIPEYLGGIFLENQVILDARLFNETLAIYTETHAYFNTSEDDTEVYTPRKTLDNQLKVFDTKPLLALKHTDVFEPSGNDDEQAIEQSKNVEKDRIWSRYKNFLSASGEHLAIMEDIHHSRFSHYETRNRYICNEYGSRQYPYRSCKANWKRVDNPDYLPPSSPGVIDCNNDLLACIQNQAKRVSRYIYVPDGETCVDKILTDTYCVAGEYKSYEVPVYDYEREMKLHVYRFHNGDFIKLDDTLATVSEDSKILVDTAPLSLEGTVLKHDHIYFKDNQFYVIRNDSINQIQILETFALHGNSIVHASSLNLSDREYVNLVANFADNQLFVSNSQYSRSQGLNWSTIQTISLANPLNPTWENELKIPTKMNRLLYTDDILLGLGALRIDGDHRLNSRYWGSLTSFEANSQMGGEGVTEEKSNLIIGSDYRSFSSQAFYDDQVLALDKNLQRVMLPHSVWGPINSGELHVRQNRLSFIDYRNGLLEEEYTFSLPAVPERMQSLSANSALAFSDEFIFSLTNMDSWRSDTVFNGKLPASIYYSRNHPTHTQKYIYPSHIEFTLIDSDDAASGDHIDTLLVERAKSQNCINESVYFDQDRILIVQEKEELYQSQDYTCTGFDVGDVDLRGYYIKDTGYEVIENQEELSNLYQLINWNLHCVFDNENKEGEQINEVPNNVNTLHCYTLEQYYRLLEQTES